MNDISISISRAMPEGVADLNRALADLSAGMKACESLGDEA